MTSFTEVCKWSMPAEGFDIIIDFRWETPNRKKLNKNYKFKKYFIKKKKRYPKRQINIKNTCYIVFVLFTQIVKVFKEWLI